MLCCVSLGSHFAPASMKNKLTTLMLVLTGLAAFESCHGRFPSSCSNVLEKATMKPKPDLLSNVLDLISAPITTRIDLRAHAKAHSTSKLGGGASVDFDTWRAFRDFSARATELQMRSPTQSRPIARLGQHERERLPTNP